MRDTRFRFIACLVAALSLPGFADELPPLSGGVAGGESTYTIQPGDMLVSIGARFGVDYRVLARDNAILNPDLIFAGRTLRIRNAHIVPAGVEEGILINIPQRMLFNFSQGRLLAAYPVGLGRPDWPTPAGKFKIVAREMNKTWVVPKSIQEEMRRERRVVFTEVPPGPDNPLGKHWLGLDLWGYGIHGTIAPSSVYDFRSHGCIRLHPDDVAALYDNVKIGTRGQLAYQPVLLAVLDDGRVLLEVHADIYAKGSDPAQAVRDMAAAYGLSEAIDWPLVETVIAAQEGLAVEVGRLPGSQAAGVKP
jgi:L,D-transpeptidase ErfK/SrfK